MACGFGYLNAITTGTLTAGAAQQPVTNLATDQGSASAAWITPVAVVTSAAGAWFSVDTGSTSSVWRAFALCRTNLSAAATVRWRVGPIGSPVYDSGTVSAGVVANYGQSVIVAAADAVGQTCRCDINDPGNGFVRIQVGLAYAGPLWLPAVGPTQSATFGRDDQTDEVVTRGGQEIPLARWARRRMELAWDGIRATDVWPQLGEMDRAARAGGNVLFVPDTASATLTQEAVFGRLQAPGDIGWAAKSANARTWRARITERL